MELRMSDELKTSLRTFFNVEVGSGIVRGSSYALVFNEDEAKVHAYLDIQQKIKDEGLNASDVLRVFQLCNGYIFDMNLRLAQKFTVDLLRDDTTVDEKLTDNDILTIRDTPRIRMEKDMKRLTKRCIEVLEKGKTDLDVALFSRIDSPQIRFNAKLDTGKAVQFTYDAYALRHTDLEATNKTYMIPKGIRVAKIQPCELLPTRSGVKFKLWIERLDPKMKIVR